jgi:hypothetical protein
MKMPRRRHASKRPGAGAEGISFDAIGRLSASPAGSALSAERRGHVAQITIQVPDEIAEAIEGAGTLTADEVEMRDLIVWNIRTRADALAGWAERAEQGRTEAQRLTAELDALTGAYVRITSEKAGVS